ncbi:hypothetical protein PAXINDRAFT_14643 [Paxillus involutus ATCC 200175]|uniref:Uncharacterized protein n=1 Tax=Paxillus involutus ATCC 200175 TaxID=664439 RepID=A0A0C9TY78_PAXIN|nr:hypothetical protein PAXINDRAFT_14643 [Paxillus involutus ATCC 200175]
MAENQNIMLATMTLPPLFHQSPTPTASPCLNPRSVLVDSTNSRIGRSGVVFAHPKVPKRVVYLTSSARINTGSSGPRYSTGHTLTPIYSRHHHLPCTPSSFPVAYKAPPTVSVSLSAACSQNRQRVLGARAQGLEQDLPDVKSVVPFPCTPLDGDGDVVMLDGIYVAFPGCSPFLVQAPPAPSGAPLPRKRRSAHSSVSSSQSNHGNRDPRDGSHSGRKRAKKSRRQVADLWWLGVVHRSITGGIEARQSMSESDASDVRMSGPHGFDAMDRMLAEKIWKRLVESGCVEGRAVPSPLPRISPPTISVPSLGPSPVLAVPIRNSPSLADPSMPSKPKANIVVSTNEIAMPDFHRPLVPTASSSSTSPPPTVPASVLSSNSTSHKPHVHFQIPPTPSHPHPHPSTTLQRSPSPPPRTAPTLAHGQTLTLTMPQLVASLTLAHRERSGLRSRGRGWKAKVKTESHDRVNGSTASCSLPASQADRCGAVADEVCGEGRMQRSFKAHARLMRSVPERKSPLSRIACVGS